MKRLLLIGIFFSLQQLNAQTDSVAFPYSEYTQNIFNPETKTFNLSYNYSNKWDIDGDGKFDSVYFIGNGGAHTYFYLRLKLSSEKKERDFPTVNVDMPYISSPEDLMKIPKSPAIQFVPFDLDKNKVFDIYINFNNTISHIPKSWSENGVTQKRVVLYSKNGKLKVRNYLQ